MQLHVQWILLSLAGRHREDQASTGSETNRAHHLLYLPTPAPSTPSTLNNEGSSEEEAIATCSTPALTSYSAILTPPQNFDMSPVSTYQGLSEIFWTSPTFTSCKLGYRLNVVVRFNPDSSLILDMVVRSAQDNRNNHMKFPCTGTAVMMILNPHSNSNHVRCTMRFVLRSPTGDPPDFSEGSSFEFPGTYIDNDCLYLQVSDIAIADSGRPWLMNPFLTNTPNNN